jgi:spermidine/putrescine transport system ATP-binding protein
MNSAAPVLRLIDVCKRFGPQTVVDHFSLDIARGGFVTLLGPSGCGKTTLLRMVAGFETPTAGRIEINGEDVVGRPPDHRPVNTVFQRYALFPHLSVAENIAFGLNLKRLGAREVRRRVDEMLSLVRLPTYGARRVHQLSGGEAQRIALARALVLSPQVLLLDEPLSALDLKIRQQLQVELRRIHQESGRTFCYVTHDQDEAMKLSDLVVVMNQGRIEQAGTPHEIYHRPATAFCATFVGESNLMRGEVVNVLPDRVEVRVAELPQPLCAVSNGRTLAAGQAVQVMVRPEAIILGEARDKAARANALTGHITDAMFSSGTMAYQVALGSGVELRVDMPWREGQRVFARGEAVGVGWSERDTRVLTR